MNNYIYYLKKLNTININEKICNDIKTGNINKEVKNINIKLFNEILKIYNERKETNISYYLNILKLSKNYKQQLFTYSIVINAINKYNYNYFNSGLKLLELMYENNVEINSYIIAPLLNAYSKYKVCNLDKNK